MGAVYKARQPGLDRVVALKILPPEVGQDPSFAERFSREARALARLSHHHIVTVHDFGRAGALYYFVMEFVDGSDLRQLIAQRKLEPREALAIVPQICEALQYAHDEGIVHRDIKPENILIDRKGRVKIADFGLAKLLHRGAGGAPHSGRPFTLTGSQQVMGTPHYMAPEQMERPLAVDHRADIYSLGVVFYEMLTGELPLGRFAPPSQKVRIDLRLDEVVLRSLEKEPERRYQHASEVKTDVETISRATSRDRVPPPGATHDTARPADDKAAPAPDRADVRQPAPVRRPRAITVLAVLNILIGTVWGLQFAVDTFSPDVSRGTFPRSVLGNAVFRLWTSIAPPLHYLAMNVLLVSGIGLLLMKPWARTASLGFSLFKIGMFIIEVPLYMTFWVVPFLAEARAQGPEAPRLAMAGLIFGLPVVFCFELFYPILLLVVLQRTNVREAFPRDGEGEDKRPEVEPGVMHPLAGSDDVDDGVLEAGRLRVQGPAGALILGGCIGLLIALGAGTWLLGQSGSSGLSIQARDTLVGMTGCLAISALLLVAAGILVHRLRQRQGALLCLALAGLFVPAVVALSVGLEFKHLLQWPLVIALGLGMPIACWATMVLFRSDVRAAFRAQAVAADAERPARRG
jgi:hypothetical protein